MNNLNRYGPPNIIQHRHGICQLRRSRTQDQRTTKKDNTRTRKLNLEYFRTGRKGIGRVTSPQYFSSRHQSKQFNTQPANIFLHEGGMVKLGDMNVSKITERGFCMTQTGTPYYASP